MVIPSNRSASPISSNRTHQSRNSDPVSAPRRSFTRPPPLSNPRHSFSSVTPANSPASGFGRKTSLVHDEKENEKDLAPAKSLPAAMTGTKGFMAPTISAASKFTPSPRKKVLVERNDPVRTSITLTDGKATFFSSLDSPVGDRDDVSTSKSSRKVTFSDDCVSKVSVSSPIIAPLDANPFVPPYDPKTNFLSPRPQFLHYKPIPRVEALLDQEIGDELGIPRSLEDNLLEVLSDSFSDSDGTEESISGVDSQKGSDDDMLPEGAEEDDLYVPEPMADETESEVVSEAHVEEAKEANGARQKKSFWKPVVMLLVLLLAGASIWADVSPFMSTLESPKIGALNMDELGSRLQKLSLDSISSLSLLMNKFSGERGHFAGDVQFVSLNLTVDSEDHKGVFSMCLKDEQKMPEQHIMDDFEDEEEDEQSDSGTQIEEPEMIDSDDSEEWESEESSDEPLVTDPPAIIEEAEMNVDHHPIIEAEMNVDIHPIIEAEMNVDHPTFEAEMNLTSETVDSAVEEPSSASIVLPEIPVELSSADEEPEIATDILDHQTVSSEKLQDSVFKIIAPLWGMIAAIVSAAATFFFWKRSNPEPLVSKTKVFEEEGSGSSEMSSSFRSEVNNYRRARKHSGDDESKRRDSMASSSSEFSMYSFGSFTTYEKIPTKKNKASGEGEILTPVRRSSRIASVHSAGR